MSKQNIVVIGASAGGIQALQVLVGLLPVDLPASLFVVVHTGASSPNFLDRILEQAGNLPVSYVRDRQEFKPGHIYLAPADYHLVLEPPQSMRTTRGPKENRFRPAVDPLFRSAAAAFGSRVVGVILSGYLDDGTAGLWAIKEYGGTAVVQSPEEALVSSMPLSALEHVAVDHCLPMREIAALLVKWSTSIVQEEPKGVDPAVSKTIETEVKIAQEDKALEKGVLDLGAPSLYACPECHGVLLQIKEGSQMRFRCHTGHAYSLESLLADFTEQNENTLWSAIRSLEETTLLLRRMATQLQEHGHTGAVEKLLTRAKESEHSTDLVRQAVMRHHPGANGT